MKLSPENFSAAVASYIDSEIGSQFSVLTRFGVALLVQPLVARIPVLLAEYSQFLQLVGYVDKDGKIDLDVLGTNLLSAFKATPKITAFGLVFSESDVEAFLHIAEKLAE